MDGDYENNKEDVLKVIQEINQPCSVEKIRKSTGLGNWLSAKTHCLELYIEDQIQGLKTSKGWTFWNSGDINE